jgi:three-Cys-motif partner protein
MEENVTDNSFFDESREKSQVKTAIVAKYFDAWSHVMIGAQKRFSAQPGKIAYIDLFAGPGRYKDGTKSTPLLILEKAIQDADLRQMLVTIFNDKDDKNKCSLDKAIHDLPGIDTLKYAPQVMCHEVGDQIVQKFAQMRLVPTLFFVDPWGYKGLSLQLINSVLKDWGCDCIFFFNYNRINMGLPNQAVKDHMDALFGKQRADRLRIRLESLPPEMRELEIIEEICQALKEMGGTFVLPFGFMNDRGTRTSHHLIFVSKAFRGYEIMKDIMARESSEALQGVASFDYSPADQRQPLLFELARPLDDLEKMLLTGFSGQTLPMQAIYERHNVGRRYIKKNYKSALMSLEQASKITADPPAAQRRQGTFGDGVRATFPREKS